MHLSRLLDIPPTTRTIQTPRHIRRHDILLATRDIIIVPTRQHNTVIERTRPRHARLERRKLHGVKLLPLPPGSSSRRAGDPTAVVVVAVAASAGAVVV